MAYRTYENTDYNNLPAEDFTATNRRVIVGSVNDGRFTYVYIPSERAQSWDGVTATHALGTRFGGYSYVNIKVSGRKDRYFPAQMLGPVRKLQITIAVGTEDEETVEGWLIGGGDSL